MRRFNRLTEIFRLAAVAALCIPDIAFAQSLTISPTTLNFAFQTGAGAPLPQTIALTSSGTPVNVNVTSSTSSGGTQWLIVSPTGQLTTPTQITVSIQPAGLAAGFTYTGNIQINSSGGTVNVPVNLLVSNNPITAGSLAQIASAGLAATGNWTTTFTVVNNGASATQIHMAFFDDNGNALPLPQIFPQTSSGVAALAATLDRTLNPEQVLIVQTTGPSTQTVQTGWAQLLYNGNVGAYAVFGQQTNGASTQEAVVPLETRTPGTFVIPFDTTGGYATGVALANVSTVAANIQFLIRDDTGAPVQSSTIALAAQGHTSFDLVSRYPVTARGRGTLEFQTPVGGQISVLGLRFPPGPAFSTIPALTK